jgi:hypothetical protein
MELAGEQEREVAIASQDVALVRWKSEVAAVEEDRQAQVAAAHAHALHNQDIGAQMAQLSESVMADAKLQDAAHENTLVQMSEVHAQRLLASEEEAHAMAVMSGNEHQLDVSELKQERDEKLAAAGVEVAAAHVHALHNQEIVAQMAQLSESVMADAKLQDAAHEKMLAQLSEEHAGRLRSAESAASAEREAAAAKEAAAKKVAQAKAAADNAAVEAKAAADNAAADKAATQAADAHAQTVSDLRAKHEEALAAADAQLVAVHARAEHKRRVLAEMTLLSDTVVADLASLSAVVRARDATISEQRARLAQLAAAAPWGGVAAEAPAEVEEAEVEEAEVEEAETPRRPTAAPAMLSGVGVQSETTPVRTTTAEFTRSRAVLRAATPDSARKANRVEFEQSRTELRAAVLSPSTAARGTPGSPPGSREDAESRGWRRGPPGSPLRALLEEAESRGWLGSPESPARQAVSRAVILRRGRVPAAAGRHNRAAAVPDRAAAWSPLTALVHAVEAEVPAEVEEAETPRRPTAAPAMLSAVGVQSEATPVCCRTTTAEFTRSRAVLRSATPDSARKANRVEFEQSRTELRAAVEPPAASPGYQLMAELNQVPRSVDTRHSEGSSSP